MILVVSLFIVTIYFLAFMNWTEEIVTLMKEIKWSWTKAAPYAVARICKGHYTRYGLGFDVQSDILLNEVRKRFPEAEEITTADDFYTGDKLIKVRIHGKPYIMRIHPVGSADYLFRILSRNCDSLRNILRGET